MLKYAIYCNQWEIVIMTNTLLLKSIPYVEFDYQTLQDAVRGYSQPRTKISGMLTKGDIIRIKKGLYILGESLRRHPFCRELLANLIYGPSYVSLEYALHYHGLIPERVESMTSVTCGRSRTFSTPVGTFSYRMIPLEAFRTGMDQVELGDGRSFLMATQEKALADQIVADRGTGISTQKEMQYYLQDNLRIDPDVIRTLDPLRLGEIARAYRSRRIKLLANLVTRMSKSSKGV
jgi:predicted transcriptional regulator of viral defense system